MAKKSFLGISVFKHIQVLCVSNISVERRRRDKINNWIVTLSKLVPDCTTEHTKGGQLGVGGSVLILPLS